MPQQSLTSPNGQLTIQVAADAAGWFYTVESESDGTTVTLISRSALGLIRADKTLGPELELLDSTTREVVDDYTLITGKQRAVRAVGNELELQFADPTGETLIVTLRAYDDGVAFRYGLPDVPADGLTISGELTQFALASPGEMWSQPYDKVSFVGPAYETMFTKGVPIGTDMLFGAGRGWSFPSLFQLDTHWLMLSETDLDASYFGAHLAPDAPDGVYTIAAPLEGEGNGVGTPEATITTAWQSPWRVIMVAETPAGILANNLINTLATPSRLDDTSWVKHGRAAWSWWSDHDSPQSYASQVAYIDFAAEYGWEFSLIDANWDRMEGGDLTQLAAYAAEKEVGLFVWYNSGGAHNEVTEAPRDRMLEREIRRAEFAWLQSLGISGVKVDFFHSDNQNRITQYIEILEDAAEYQLMVNFHGGTIPRGWTRTWPHMMTMESVRGAEQYFFDVNYGEIAPWHNVVLAYTRNVIGPMDYTPVTFTTRNSPRQTTDAHELALSVVFETGIQHYADSATMYRSQPDAVQAFLQAVPAVWDELRWLGGEPAGYIVLARRHGSDWYIAGLNGQEEPQTVTLNLDFVAADALTLITDATNGRGFISESTSLTTGAPLSLTLAPHGGFILYSSQK